MAAAFLNTFGNGGGALAPWLTAVLMEAFGWHVAIGFACAVCGLGGLRLGIDATERIRISGGRRAAGPDQLGQRGRKGPPRLVRLRLNFRRQIGDVDKQIPVEASRIDDTRFDWRTTVTDKHIAAVHHRDRSSLPIMVPQKTLVPGPAITTFSATVATLMVLCMDTAAKPERSAEEVASL